MRFPALNCKRHIFVTDGAFLQRGFGGVQLRGGRHLAATARPQLPIKCWQRQSGAVQQGTPAFLRPCPGVRLQCCRHCACLAMHSGSSTPACKPVGPAVYTAVQGWIDLAKRDCQAGMRAWHGRDSSMTRRELWHDMTCGCILWYSQVEVQLTLVFIGKQVVPYLLSDVVGILPVRNQISILQLPDLRSWCVAAHFTGMLTPCVEAYRSQKCSR